MLSATGTFFGRINGVASIPTEDVVDGSASEINMASRNVSPGDTISLIAPHACIVTLAYYR